MLCCCTEQKDSVRFYYFKCSGLLFWASGLSFDIESAVLTDLKPKTTVFDQNLQILTRNSGFWPKTVVSGDLAKVGCMRFRPRIK